MDISERDKAIADHRKAMMEADFNPGYTPERTPAAEIRMVNAAEYVAYQLGQINRKLDRLIAAAERIAGGQPDPRSFSQIKAERDAQRGG